METRAYGKDSVLYDAEEEDQNDRNRNTVAVERQNWSLSCDTHFSSISIIAKTMKGVTSRRIRRKRELIEMLLFRQPRHTCLIQNMICLTSMQLRSNFPQQPPPPHSHHNPNDTTFGISLSLPDLFPTLALFQPLPSTKAHI